MAWVREMRVILSWCAVGVLTGCASASAPSAPVLVAGPRADHAMDEPGDLLSATGLYKDIAHGILATGTLEYTPRFPFWSDGAGMRRFALLPAGAKIDVSDMDHWSFPAGTRFWKTFDVGGVVVETDLIEKTGPQPNDVRFSAYAWRPDGKDAELSPLGVKNARGTGRDSPPVGACTSCHGKLEERIIGFSALQLSHPAAGMTPHLLNERGLLSAPLPDAGFEIPGDATAVAALGYLHANCGHCHYEQTKRPMHLRLKVTDHTVEETAAFRTGVGVESGFKIAGVTTRISPAHPDASAVHYRMSVRTKGHQMPNWGTKRVDDQGLATVDAWIAQLTPPRER